MSEDAKITIDTIKMGELPKIEISKPKDHSGLEVSQRGLEITNYGLNTKKKK